MCALRLLGVSSAALAFASTFASCSERTTPSPRDAGADARWWESVEVLADDGTVVSEKVSYRSQGLRIFGLVCRPSAPGRYRLLVVNHGGFGGLSGLGQFKPDACAGFVRDGWVVVESSYRGEDGSEGAVEVCLGEVDDVLAMLAIARRLPYVDDTRVAMIGYSHGGCITMRAVERGAPVQAAVDVFGEKDWQDDFHYWQSEHATDPGATDENLHVLRDTTGGGPDDMPDAYVARSPLSYVAALDAFQGAYMTVHGAKDDQAHVRDTCRFAAVAEGMLAYHVDEKMAVVTSEPHGCERTSVRWLPGPKPTAPWPGARYVVVYDGAGHEIESPSGRAMNADAFSFLAAKLSATPP